MSDADAVQALADFAFDTFGAVHLLCNNAGVSPAGRIWDFTDDEWRWLLGVNVHGVANGHPELRAPHDRAGRGTHRQHRFRCQLRVDAPSRALLRDQHAIVGLSEALRYELDGTRHRGAACSSRRA